MWKVSIVMIIVWPQGAGLFDHDNLCQLTSFKVIIKCTSSSSIYFNYNSAIVIKSKLCLPKL